MRSAWNEVDQWFIFQILACMPLYLVFMFLASSQYMLLQSIILFFLLKFKYLGCVRIIQVDCPELFTMFRNSKDSTSQSRDSYRSTRHANCQVSCIR